MYMYTVTYKYTNYPQIEQVHKVLTGTQSTYRETKYLQANTGIKFAHRLNRFIMSLQV